MSDTITREETALSDEEVPEAVGDTTKQEEEVAAADEAAGGDSGGKKPFIVYYNALSRVVMACFLIAAGLFAIPDFWLNTPSGDFMHCGE